MKLHCKALLFLALLCGAEVVRAQGIFANMPKWTPPKLPFNNDVVSTIQDGVSTIQGYVFNGFKTDGKMDVKTYCEDLAGSGYTGHKNSTKKVKHGAGGKVIYDPNNDVTTATDPNAFCNPDGSINFDSTAITDAITADINAAGIAAQAFSLVSFILFTLGGVFGVYSATIALVGAEALYADALASLALEFASFEQTLEADAPDDLAALAGVISRFAAARQVVAGPAANVLTSLLGSAAAGTGSTISNGAFLSKMEDALAAIKQVQTITGNVAALPVGKKLSAYGIL